MRCHSTRILSKNKISYIAGSSYPHLTVSSSSNFLNFYFYTFTAFSPKQICISKVLVCILLSFCDTFRLVYNSDHNSRFSILRLYIVGVFARSLEGFATTCNACCGHLDRLRIAVSSANVDIVSCLLVGISEV